MLRLRWKRRLVVCAATVILALAGCTSRQPATPPPPEAPPPSQVYLSKPVPAGWLRTVGRSNDLVLIFECQKVAAHDKALRYRFVVVNESPDARSWDDALFVVGHKNAAGYPDPDPNDNLVPTGLGGVSGDYLISGLGPYEYPGLVLRSGESTTHAGELSGREGRGDEPYRSQITPSFKGGDKRSAEVLVSAPYVTVRLE